MQNERTVSPYWSHDSMDCLEATKHQWRLSEKLILNKVSLDAAIFYKGILRYDPGLRVEMLNYQKQCIEQHAWLYSAIKTISKWCNKCLARDLNASLGSITKDQVKPLSVADIPSQPITLKK